MMLLRLDHVGVKKLFDDMEKEVDRIRNTAIQLSWYMRGGASYEDVLNMSMAERKMISEMVDKHLEITKDSKLPFF